MVLTRAEINLQALRQNFDHIKKRVGSNVKIMGVVKANAYGHGIVEVAQAITQYGVDYFGVGFLQEGISLRKKGIQTPILVLGGVLGSQIKEFLNHNLDVTVSSIEIAERIEQEAASNGGKKARVHLKIDTGSAKPTTISSLDQGRTWIISNSQNSSPSPAANDPLPDRDLQ